MATVERRPEAKDEYELGLGKLSWGSVYLSCLENKEEMCRYDTKPRFRIMATVDRHGLSKRDLRHLNQRGYFERVPFAPRRNCVSRQNFSEGQWLIGSLLLGAVFFLFAAKDFRLCLFLVHLPDLHGTLYGLCLIRHRCLNTYKEALTCSWSSLIVCGRLDW
jgi:hypothetical protein